MSRTMLRSLLAFAWMPAALALAPGTARPADIGAAITYQGSLSDGGTSPTGLYDFRFTLFDAASGGTQVGSPITLDDVQVTAGIFTVGLDWGATVFSVATARWLLVEVRAGASTGSYTVLPRQKLDPTPFAIGLSLPHFQTTGSASPLFSMNNSGAGAGGLFASSGMYGLIGRSVSTASQAAGIHGEGNGATGLTIGVEGLAIASPTGTGLVGTGTATGAYATGTGPSGVGVYARGYLQGLNAENLGTGPAIYAKGKGLTRTNATLKVENTETTQGMCAYMFNNSDFATAHLQNSGAGEVLWLDHEGTGNYIVCYSPTGWKFWVDNAGVTHTKVLEILGGADLSERFDVQDEGRAIEPGTVVSIDPGHEGRLLRSRTAYDHRVAGIISGAGGVKTGMLMGQKGSAADGAQPVALTGRVYCRATAANGPIAAGDLLTTSWVPGHAMRVDDPSRAQGAILGKAMGTLAKGEGLVLVLVGLQ